MWPNALISSASWGVSSRGAWPRASLAAWMRWRMWSTISGLARVETSSTSVKLEIPAMTRRMIFPERVLGMSGTIHTLAGRAILPISCSIAAVTFRAMSSLGVAQEFGDHPEVAVTRMCWARRMVEETFGRSGPHAAGPGPFHRFATGGSRAA